MLIGAIIFPSKLQLQIIFVYTFSQNHHIMSSFYDFALNFVGTAAVASKCIKYVGCLHLASSIRRIQEAQGRLTDDEQATLTTIWNQLLECYQYNNLSHSDLNTHRQILKSVANNVLTRERQAYYNDPNGHVAMSKHLHNALERIAYGLRFRYQNKSSLKDATSQR
jgi:hypothetical protein